ncbi:hypothetical protein KCQ64_29325, partial [Klebsiella pneumoniae]|nr:hypothetical protein [Klebsiella pneumoniae]
MRGRWSWYAFRRTRGAGRLTTSAPRRRLLSAGYTGICGHYSCLGSRMRSTQFSALDAPVIPGAKIFFT